MIKDDEILWDEIHDLMRSEYEFKYHSLQQLVAEMVIKTHHHKSKSKQERFDEIIFNLIGKPKEKVASHDHHEFVKDLGLVARLYNESQRNDEIPLKLGVVIANIARQSLLWKYGYIRGKAIPKNISEKEDRLVKNYIRRLKRNIKNYDIDQLEIEYVENMDQEAEVIFGDKSEIVYAKSLLSLWLDMNTEKLQNGQTPPN